MSVGIGWSMLILVAMTCFMWPAAVLLTVVSDDFDQVAQDVQVTVTHNIQANMVMLNLLVVRGFYWGPHLVRPLCEVHDYKMALFMLLLIMLALGLGVSLII